MTQDTRPDIVEAFSSLSSEETVFVYAYCNTFNATEAYLQVQPEVERLSASTMGWAMMRRAQVKTAIALHLEERKQNYELDFKLILHNLLAVANGNISDFMDEEGEIDPILIKRAPPAIQRMVEGIETSFSTDRHTGQVTRKAKLKLRDGLRAAELIGKHLKQFTDKVELGGPDGKELAFTVTQKPYKADPTDDKG